MITHVILDLDGTLYEKKSSVTNEILSKISEKFQLDFQDVRNKVKKFESDIKSESFKFSTNQEFYNEVYKRIILNFNISDSKENLKIVSNIIQNSIDNILLDVVPKKGVVSFLEFLQKEKIKIIVFSGGKGENIVIDKEVRNKNYKNDLDFKKLQIAKLGLTDYFNEVLCSSMFNGYKPEKKVFEALINHLKCRGEDCVMIGDSINDIAALQVGMKTILINDTQFKGDFAPDFWVKNFSEVEGAVKSLL